MAVALTLWACGGGQAPPGDTGEPGPSQSAGGEQATGAAKAEIDAQLAQESGPFQVHEVRAPDGSFTARLEGSAPPTAAAGEGFVHLIAPFGAHPLQCFVYPEAKDGAEVIRLIAGATLDEAAPEHGWVDVHGDQIEGFPYVVGRAHYLVDSPQGKLIGDFKIAAGVRDQTTVACLMDAPGNYASFERALRTFLSSLDAAGSERSPPPIADEIVRTRLAGRMVGIDHVVRRKQGKDVVVVKTTTELTISPEGKLATLDRAATEVYRGGRLHSGTYASATMGKMAYTMELSSRKARYHVEGTVQGEPASADFVVAGGIPDEAGRRALGCGVRAGKKPRAEIKDYAPGIDPLAPTSVVIEKVEHPEADVRWSFRSMQALVSLDARCAPRRGSMQVGQAVVEMERLFGGEDGG